MRVNSDPTKKEMIAFLEQCGEVAILGIEVDIFDIEAAIYWFASDYHGGQRSNLYSALSCSEYKPSRLARGIEKDSVESFLYDALVKNFTE